MKVKDRRITKPQHIRALMQEQINLVRRDGDIGTVERARTLAYLSTVALTSISQCELEERLQALEKALEEKAS